MKWPVRGPQLLSSTCWIIIGSTIYDNTVPVFNITMPDIPQQDLAAHHKVSLDSKGLSNPDDLLADISQIQESPIHLARVTHIVHYSFTFFLLLTVVCVSILVIKFRRRLHTLICASNPILRIKKTNSTNSPMELQHLANNHNHQLCPTLSVDAQS